MLLDYYNRKNPAGIEASAPQVSMRLALFPFSPRLLKCKDPYLSKYSELSSLLKFKYVRSKVAG